jgi:hypothetical protein
MKARFRTLAAEALSVSDHAIEPCLIKVTPLVIENAKAGVETQTSDCMIARIADSHGRKLFERAYMRKSIKDCAAKSGICPDFRAIVF